MSRWPNAVQWMLAGVVGLGWALTLVTYINSTDTYPPGWSLWHSISSAIVLLAIGKCPREWLGSWRETAWNGVVCVLIVVGMAYPLLRFGLHLF